MNPECLQKFENVNQGKHQYVMVKFAPSYAEVIVNKTGDSSEWHYFSMNLKRMKTTFCRKLVGIGAELQATGVSQITYDTGMLRDPADVWNAGNLTWFYD